MKYHKLSPSELETYNIGYMVGNRKIVITDVEWDSEQEHKIYRKGYMAGLMDYKRNVSNVSNVHSQDNVSNVDFRTPITSTTPIGNSISNSNKEIDNDKEEDLITKLEKEELAKVKKTHKPPKEQPKILYTGKHEYLKAQIERWLEYKQSRKEMYKSPQSVLVCVKRLHELCGGDVSLAEKIIDQSIGNNWAGFFPLKQQQQKAKSITSPDYVGEGSFLRRAEDDPFCADL